MAAAGTPTHQPLLALSTPQLALQPFAPALSATLRGAVAAPHSPAAPSAPAATTPSPIPAYRRPALSDAEQADIRREIGVASKSGLTAEINVHHYRARLQNLARRIPDFESYRKMVVDDLRDSSHHDRVTGERRTHNQQEQWRRLFKYWAASTGETLLVQIRWLGTDGAYECKLVDRPEIDVWERFIDAGVDAGVPLTVLNDLYKKYCNAPAKAIRPNRRKFTRRGTGPAALPGEPIEKAVSSFNETSGAVAIAPDHPPTQ